MSKNVLILTDEIAPPAYAPRIVSLCRYLKREGWTCTVFSDRLAGIAPFTNADAEWHQMQYYTTQCTSRYLADKIFQARERAFQRMVEQTSDVSKADIILCSSCYYFPLRTAYRLAKKYHKPYIVDLRDIAEQWGRLPYRTHRLSASGWLNERLGELYQAVSLRRRNRILSEAQTVVTISSWHRNILSRYNPHTELIYNGFDEQEFQPKDIQADQFRIGYTGKIYNTAFRDPRLMLEAVGGLLREGKMDRARVEIVFHVDEPSREAVRQLAMQYGVDDICLIEGYIPREETVAFLHRCSILMVLTCLSTPEGSHGILGTKFYEALGVEKPVLCVRSDEECLAEVISLTQAGTSASNVHEAKAFIETKYREWERKGYTRQKVNQQEKARFTRQYEAAQFEKLLLFRQ